MARMNSDSLDSWNAEIKKNEAISAEKLEKAKNVIHRCFEVLPEKNVPYDRVVHSFVSLAYEVCDSTLGDQLVRRLVQIHDENMEYYFSTDIRFSYNMMEAISVSRSILSMMRGIALERYNRKHLAAEIDPVVMKHNAAFEAWVEDVLKYDKRTGMKQLQQFFGG